MGFYKHLETWPDNPVIDWTTEIGQLDAKMAYRIRVEWEEKESWLDKFAQFLEKPGHETVTSLVVGAWGDDMMEGGNIVAIVEAITGAREKLPALTALFIGDVTGEESEVSWIALTDVSPLFHAYPKLEHFAIRGGNSLSLGVPRHAHLKSLTIQTGGLDTSVIEEISASELPALEKLMVYLGTDNYGGTVTPDDLHTILHQGHEKWPNLRYLGLVDYDRADELAVVIASGDGSPVLSHLDVLDLSLGTLGNEGVAALVACPTLAQLKKLDIHHHYASEEALAPLLALGIEVDASNPQKADEDGDEEWRYVAVGE